MAQRGYNYTPKPGVQQPGKYPFVGPNYQIYGEQPGWVYNPYSDRYDPDPRAVKQMQEEQGLIEKQKAPPGLFESLLPIAGAGAALYGGKYIGENLGNINLSGAVDKVTGLFDTNAGAKATEALSVTQSTPVPVGSSIDGSTMMSDGSLVTNDLPNESIITNDGSIINSETGATIGRVVQGAFGAYQIYQGISDFKKDKIGGALGVAAGGANVGAALGSQTAGSYAGPLMIAKGGYDLYNSLQHGGENIRSSGATLGAGIGSMIAPGIGTVAGAVIGNAVGYGLDKLGVAHETTRQRQAKVSNKLFKAMGDDPVAQQYVAAVREQYKEAPKGKAWHGGDYETWEEYKKAGLDASDLTHVEGNISTYGAEWAHLSEEQRRAIVQANINSDLYSSKDGGVQIVDKAQAQKNKDLVLSNKYVPPPPVTNSASAPTGLMDSPQQTSTPPRTVNAIAAQAQPNPGTMNLQQPQSGQYQNLPLQNLPGSVSGQGLQNLPQGLNGITSEQARKWYEQAGPNMETITPQIMNKPQITPNLDPNGPKPPGMSDEIWNFIKNKGPMVPYNQPTGLLGG